MASKSTYTVVPALSFLTSTTSDLAVGVTVPAVEVTVTVDVYAGVTDAANAEPDVSISAARSSDVKRFIFLLSMDC